MSMGNLEIGVCDDSLEDLKRIQIAIYKAAEKLGRENPSPFIYIKMVYPCIRIVKVKDSVLYFWIGRCQK